MHDVQIEWQDGAAIYATHGSACIPRRGWPHRAQTLHDRRPYQRILRPSMPAGSMPQARRRAVRRARLEDGQGQGTIDTPRWMAHTRGVRAMSMEDRRSYVSMAGHKVLLVSAVWFTEMCLPGHAQCHSERCRVRDRCGMAPMERASRTSDTTTEGDACRSTERPDRCRL